MRLSFEERPYSGSSFRPRPEVHFDENGNFLIVATPWGARTAARKWIERMLEYLQVAREDMEVTSPFERLTSLSPLANNLRIAALLANEAIYRAENVSEYHSGVELFAASVNENELVWIQAGAPHIFLYRKNKGLVALAGANDLSFDLSEEKPLPALPSRLLGLEATATLNVGSCRLQPGDQVIMLSHSFPPHQLFSLSEEKLELELLSSMISKQNADLGFWLGLLHASE